MTPSLRRRILLLTLPAVLLPALIGASGVWLLGDLGRRAEEIIRDNYVSLGAMADVQIALADAERNPEARSDVARRARGACEVELANVTVPGEGPEAQALAAAVDEAFRPGADFAAAAAQARGHADAIRRLNEGAMFAADRSSREAARRSIRVLGVAVAAAFVVTVVLAWRLRRGILGPIVALTEAAEAIGAGRGYQMVEVSTRDEVGRLAEAFNAMSAKLRAFRRTNTQRLLRARQTARATIDSFPDPVVVLDTQGRAEVANPAAQRLLGVTGPAEGAEPAAWVPPESLRPAVEDALARSRDVVSETFDQAVTFRLEGEDRVYLPQARPIRTPEGEPLGAAVVLHDVTRFRLLDRLKSDWVATVSHELKTPLTGVRLAVHVLLEEVVGPLEPKQAELLVEARDNAERLMRLIEHLLSLARLEDGRERLELRPTDPATLLRAAADEATSRAEDRRVSLSVEADPDLPLVSADAARVGRALNNLIDNALTHTEAGGRVTLSAAPAEGGGVTLTVADTGVGIPPEHLPHVFERFFRVPGRDATPGTGLGLAIVREIVTAHGGTIACASEPGKGTVFTIALPAAGRGGDGPPGGVN